MNPKSSPQVDSPIKADGKIPWAAGLALAIAGVVLVLFVGMTTYAYPALDDWFSAADGRDRGIFPSLASYWQGTGGRWVAASLLYSLGLVQNMVHWYPLLLAISVTFIALTPLPLLLAAGTPKDRRLLAVILVSAILLSSLPTITYGNLGWHVPTFETLYWASGSWTYALAAPFLATAIAIALRSTSPTAIPALVLLGIFITGLSETAAILAIGSGIMLGLCGCRRAWWLVGAASVGFIASVLAPGNAQRAKVLESQVTHASPWERIPDAVQMAFGLAANRLGQWLSHPAMVMGIVFASTLGAEQGRSDAMAWRRRLWIVLAALPFLIAVSAFPSLLLVGFLEGRQEGVLSLVATSWLLTAGWLAGRAFGPIRSTLTLSILAALAISIHLAVSPLTWDPLAIYGMAGGGILIVGGWWRWCTHRGPWLAVAVVGGVLLNPWLWTVATDAVYRSPNLRQAQRQRDRQIAEWLAKGQDSLAIPWLGRQEILPRSTNRFEIQQNWIGDGYTRYLGVRRYILVPGLDRVKVWQEAKAPSVPPSLNNELQSSGTLTPAGTTP
jgi:hypothetical protein